jgi:ArsR family transcriptional regulator
MFMNPQDPYAEAAEVFKALSDPTRLKILHSLHCCPAELGTAGTQTASQVCCSVTGTETINSTVSHHLKILREAGLIDMERIGKTMACCPNPGGIAKAEEYLRRITESPDNCCE